MSLGNTGQHQSQGRTGKQAVLPRCSEDTASIQSPALRLNVAPSHVPLELHVQMRDGMDPLGRGDDGMPVWRDGLVFRWCLRSIHSARVERRVVLAVWRIGAAGKRRTPQYAGPVPGDQMVDQRCSNDVSVGPTITRSSPRRPDWNRVPCAVCSTVASWPRICVRQIH